MTDKLEKMNPKVAVFSVIRRWDHYVPRTIDSVVAQTYENWEWYIYTSPKSQDEIEAVTKDEPRIHLVPNRNFHCHCEDMTKGEKLSNGIVETAQKGDFFCVIDGDDRMTEDFMEYQLEYILKHDLDISTSAYLTCDENGTLLNTDSGMRQDIVLDRDTFFDILPGYLMRYWTMWGRMSKSALFTTELYENMPLLRASNDAPITLSTLKKAKRLGLTEKVGYLYSVHESGMSFQNFHPKRECEPFQIHGIVTEMLQTMGDDTEKIQYTALYSLLGDLQFTFRALLASQHAADEKITLLHWIYTHELTKETFVAQTVFADFFQREAKAVSSFSVFTKNVSDLKLHFFRFFAGLLKEKHQFSLEQQGELLEILCVMEPEFCGYFSFSALEFMISTPRLNLSYFNDDFVQLKAEMEKKRQTSPRSIGFAEVLYAVGRKLGDKTFIAESLILRLKFYQEVGDMEKTMAVMDEMIEKNIQFG